MAARTLFFLYEAGLFLLALAIVSRLFRCRGRRPFRRPEFWALWLATKLFIGCSFAMVITFLAANSAMLYCAIGAIAGVAGTCVIKGSWEELRVFRPQPGERRGPGRYALAMWLAYGILLAAALVTNVGPVNETDSVAHMNALLDWQGNIAGPYDFPNAYVSFWELGYLPSLIMTASDSYLWWISLQAVALFGLALFSLAVFLSLPPETSGWITLSALALPHFWWGPSGVMTIKNDMIYGAGILCFVLGLLLFLTEEESGASVCLCLVGAAFVCCKYSGPFLLTAVVLSLTALLYGQRRRWPRLLGAAVVVLAGVMGSSGHYFVKNIYVFGNPVHPIGLNVLGWQLPGIDLSGTSIISSLNQMSAWRILLGFDGGIHPGGVLFPMMLLSVISLGPVLMIRLFRQDGPGRAAIKPETVLLPVILIGWALYLSSYWSASSRPGDLAYLRALVSKLAQATPIWTG